MGRGRPGRNPRGPKDRFMKASFRIRAGASGKAAPAGMDPLQMRMVSAIVSAEQLPVNENLDRK